MQKYKCVLKSESAGVKAHVYIHNKPLWSCRAGGGECLWLTYSEDHLRVMLLMKSCVFKPACVKRPTLQTPPARQATRPAASLIHSGSVRKPRRGPNLGNILCKAACSSCDPPCVTHFVLTCEGLPQCGLVLRWQNKKG